MCRNILLFGIVFFCCAVSTAQNSVEDYYTIRKEYAQLRENNANALPAIAISIKLAKNKQNFKHLFYAYEDAALYSPDREDKLKYADSCLSTAQKTKDATMISTAYLGKGIVYYFNFRKFDKALDHYLLAAKSAEKTTDAYLQYKIKYNIGVVKSYLGYYPEALLYFHECKLFFETNLKSNLSPPLLFNNTRGYLNTIHQIMICERQLHHWEKVDRLLKETGRYRNNADFNQEKGYFLKERGIALFNKNQYEQAIDSLIIAEDMLQHKKEESHLAVTYFYLAKAYLKMNNSSLSTGYLKKVDSLFTRNEAVLPEVRKTYEILLKNKYLAISALESAHYTEQLMKADSILHHDLPNLSSRIFTEYDTKSLVAEKEKLIQAKNVRNTIITITTLLIGCLIFFLYTINQKRKKNLQSYQNIVRQYETVTTATPVTSVPTTPDRKSTYSSALIEKLLKKLEEFELTNGFIVQDITLGSLALEMQTNKTHLSYVINEHKQMTWPTYLKTLRINYITNLMLRNPTYLHYNVGVLGEMCGYKSRQQFAKQFCEIHQLSPLEFINLRTKNN
ncbi:helix-turn-helix transcriptional regulator [Kaistella flava (ex Peng et al. 2021)]|uniref:Helix-turn-helix transcriptional regulator n=1 Tax=Kaistella flava (ex Peng et al. 2021) TaxID=2038776 RepID=A0A7M2YAM1_9FLAO|nr:helix-turn-helix transcriptional regulator [Kaistella flava (ex Peng et al. 2021)]QOW10614.1 helix-turn-helix transcriptional regulator [Kaistella flava (ex Peng et al. 2021)]